MSLESTVLPMLRPNGAKVDTGVEWKAIKYGNVEYINCDGKVSESRRIDILTHLSKPAYHSKPKAIAYFAMVPA